MLPFFFKKQNSIFILSIQRWHFWTIIFVDIFLLIAAHYLAYIIRFDFNYHLQHHVFFSYIPLIITIKITIFFLTFNPAAQKKVSFS